MMRKINYQELEDKLQQIYPTLSRKEAKLLSNNYSLFGEIWLKIPINSKNSF